MRVQCQACSGHGQVISARSARQGHTHSNDPDREDETCTSCDGTGDREATASDLDGARVRYLWLEGYVTYERRNDTLTLDTDDVTVVNLQPRHLQVLA